MFFFYIYIYSTYHRHIHPQHIPTSPGISPCTVTLQRGIEVVRGDSDAAIERGQDDTAVVDQIICQVLGLKGDY